MAVLFAKNSLKLLPGTGRWLGEVGCGRCCEAISCWHWPVWAQLMMTIAASISWACTVCWVTSSSIFCNLGVHPRRKILILDAKWRWRIFKSDFPKSMHLGYAPRSPDFWTCILHRSFGTAGTEVRKATQSQCDWWIESIIWVSHLAFISS